MRYVLEVKKLDESKEEFIVGNEDANHVSLAQLCAFHGFQMSEVFKSTLWREYDDIEEAASDNDQCVYYIGENDGKRTLRSCSASQSRSLWR